MKTIKLVLTAALLLAASSALAGSGEKCTYDTQSCLNHWAAKKDAGWAGLDYDKSVPGVVKVKAVTPDSPAAAAGFQPGDVIVAMNGAKMADKEALKKAKGSWKAGQSVNYTIQRGGAEQQIALTLGKTPDQVFTSMAGAHMMESHAVITTAAASEKK